MKKLNRKGFTLVELLAVIVILAIVVGITLVTVLPTLQKSRDKAFQLTADTAADYYQKQYELYTTGYTATGESIFTSETQINKVITMSNKDYVAAGLKPSNYKSGYYKIDSTTGRACVQLERATKNDNTAAEYYDSLGTERDGITLSGACNGIKIYTPSTETTTPSTETDKTDETTETE